MSSQANEVERESCGSETVLFFTEEDQRLNPWRDRLTTSEEVSNVLPENVVMGEFVELENPEPIRRK